MTEYLDNAATTKPFPEAIDAAVRTHCSFWANPNSRHKAGQAANSQIEVSKEIVAGALHTKKDNIFFTSSATESNLAV